MSPSLKTGWAPCRLGDVLTLVNGRAYKQPEMLQKGTPILRIQNLNGGNNWFYSDLTLPDDKFCVEGDLLYAWSATFGPYIYQGPKAIFHYHIWNVHPSFAVEKQFVYYELMRITDGIKQAAHGVAMPHITKAGMEDWELNLPPLPEQKRIADKLDSVLARVDACRDRLDRLPALLKRFRQSILAAATSGRLTEDWRGSVALSNWATVSVKEICLSVSDGDHQAPPQATSGIPFITISAFNTGHLELHKASRFVPKEYFGSLSSIRRPARGDVLYSVTGSIGIAALVDVDAEFTFQRHVAILKPDHSRVSSAYLLHLLSSEMIKEQAQLIATGTAQLTIPLNGLRAFVINLPSPNEQTEIVRRVEILFAFADRLEARLATARRQVGQLTSALLAKAFRGELVAQDPADEPAAELLKRLAAQREVAPKVKRGRAKG